MEGEKNLQAREKEGTAPIRSLWTVGSVGELLPNGLDLFPAIREEGGEGRAAVRGKASDRETRRERVWKSCPGHES